MKRAIPISYRHPRESGGPGATARRSPPVQARGRLWVTAFAGMTAKGLIFRNSFRVGLSAAARDTLRQNGKQQAKGRVAENDLAADDDFTRQGSWLHITKTECRISHDRGIVGCKPGFGAVLVVEYVGKNTINRPIEGCQAERNRRDAEQAAAIIDQPPGSAQN